MEPPYQAQVSEYPPQGLGSDLETFLSNNVSVWRVIWPNIIMSERELHR